MIDINELFRMLGLAQYELVKRDNALHAMEDKYNSLLIDHQNLKSRVEHIIGDLEQGKNV